MFSKLRRNLFVFLGGICFLAVICSPASGGRLVCQVRQPDNSPVANAVVALYPENGTTPLPADKVTPTAKMEQRDKRFVPHVLAIRAGTRVAFPNFDDIKHHVYSFSPPKRFEIRLYRGEPGKTVLFDKPGVVALGCNIHDWMLAYIYVLDTPYFSKSDASGQAGIDHLATGNYRLTIWHPRLKNPSDTPKRQITIRDSKNPPITLTLDLKPEVRRRIPPIYERGSRY